MSKEVLNVRCCISGGGPAGVMLGYLLARSGIEVAVLEKWPDFFRDFRGDTIHPSTMEVLHELGILESFLNLPHDETQKFEGDIGEARVITADFAGLKMRCPFIAFIPQWDFLNFISKEAQHYPAFHLMMETEAVDLIEEEGCVAGIRAKNPKGEIEIRADLVVGADGRHSTIREKSGLKIDNLGAPIDVLWFRISRKESDPKQSMGRIDEGKMMVMLERGDYWQCGFIIRKGDFENIQKEGLESFRTTIADLMPFLHDRSREIADWNSVKLLTVTVDHLQKWYKDGLLCIGDASHAMSPVGGVGINLAIQDAVAAANILIPKFLGGGVKLRDLAAVQRRREFPTRLTQRLQIFIQNKLIGKVLGVPGHPKLAWPLKLLARYPYFRRIPAYIIGIGFRPEHIKISNKFKPAEY